MILNLSFILPTLSPLVRHIFITSYLCHSLAPIYQLILSPLSHILVSRLTNAIFYPVPPDFTHTTHPSLPQYSLAQSRSTLSPGHLPLSFTKSTVSPPHNTFSYHFLPSITQPTSSLLSLNFGSWPLPYSLQTPSPFYSSNSPPTVISWISFTNVVMLWYAILLICSDFSYQCFEICKLCIEKLKWRT